MSRFWNDPAWVGKSTLIATGLLEWANVSQLWRMWAEHTSAGQSVIAWASVLLALVIFFNFYRVNRMRLQMWGGAIGIVMNVAVVATVLYFRRFA